MLRHMNVHDTAAPAALNRADTADLVKRAVGPVSLPTDAGYQSECGTFNLMSAVRPAIAVGATSVADLQAAVRFAAERDLPVAVLATGHQMVRSAERRGTDQHVPDECGPRRPWPKPRPRRRWHPLAPGTRRG